MRPERRVRDRRLSRERIVRVVVEVLDAEGHDGLSMRRVAERLGVTPGSLYWHVATKDEMVELALDAVLGEVDIAAAERMADWRQALLTVAQAHRAVMLRHRWMIPLLSTRRTLGPNALRAAEHTLRVLSRAGFDEDMLDAALSALNQLVVGAVVFESAWREGAEAAGRGRRPSAGGGGGVRAPDRRAAPVAGGGEVRHRPTGQGGRVGGPVRLRVRLPAERPGGLPERARNSVTSRPRNTPLSVMDKEMLRRRRSG
nr:hypothetical protein GCM10020241_16750 [Streptoalloteichus tenebrarius]